MIQPIQTKRQSSTFLRYIHNFRAIAILVVVISHVLVYMDWEDSKESFVIFKALFKDGTAYFIFIAGFLFQYLSKKYAYGDYLKKKFNNVILPYLIISIPAIFYCISQGKVSNDVWFKDFFPSWPLPYQVVALYSTGGHLYTLWFIPMIAIFYVISPLLIFVDKNPKLYWSLLLLIPSGLVFPRPAIHEIPQSFLYYFPIYTLGMFVSHYLEYVLSFRKKLFIPLAIISVILTCVSAYQIYLETMPYGVSMFSTHTFFRTLNREIQCFLIIFILYSLDKKMPDYTHKGLGFIADISFGIYFLHGYVISIYFKLASRIPIINLNSRQASPILFILIFTLLTSICVILVVIIKRFSGKSSRYIIGY